MGAGDDAAAADLRELRALLKSAQNDVKRYAAHVVRLQQELDRERLASRSTTLDAPSNNDSVLQGQELRDSEIEGTSKDAESAQKSLARLLREATTDCDVCHCRRSHIDKEDDTQTQRTDTAQLIQSVRKVLDAQKKQIEALARENAKLRDTLETRPTHRDLARSEWQIERLQEQVARLKDHERGALPQFDTSVPVFDTAPQETLTDRISVDKLLSWLHVETKKVKHPEGTQSKRNRRRFLKEPVECFLVLDAAALDGPSGSSASENEKMKKREQLSRRVGIVCSEIVASCCHSVGVYEVAKLPRYVEATYQYAQLVPYLQEFALRIDDLMQAAGMGPSLGKASKRDTRSETYLETLSSRVQDLVFEVRARREQMAPPGDRAFAVVLRCMKLLQADHIDQLGPTIEKLLDTTRSERGFLQDIRQVLGLDVAASRATVLELITRLMEQIGMTTTTHPPARSRSTSRGGLTSSQAGRQYG